MRYHGFYVKITPLKNIQREKKDGSIVWRDGFQIDIYSDAAENCRLDSFSAAVDFEILNDSLYDAEQFAKDVINCEEKEYFRLIKS